MKKRYFEIAAAHSIGLRLIIMLPPLSEMRHQPFNARSLPAAGIIMVHRPDTLKRLWRFLHECGHVHLHRHTPLDTPSHKLELDANQYAQKALEEAGLGAAIEALKRESQSNVFCELGADLRAGFSPATGVFDYVGMNQDEAKEYVARLASLPRTTKFLRGSARARYEQDLANKSPQEARPRSYSSGPVLQESA
jgi:hypothetical protein